MPTAQDILAKNRKNVAIIGEEDTVMEAAKIMSDQHIGSLVVGRAESVVGIFTERDVLNRVVAKYLDPMKTIVKDVMTTPVACCQPTTKLAECRSVMTEKRIRHLPVVEDNQLVGMISSGASLPWSTGSSSGRSSTCTNICMKAPARSRWQQGIPPAADQRADTRWLSSESSLVMLSLLYHESSRIIQQETRIRCACGSAGLWAQAAARGVR